MEGNKFRLHMHMICDVLDHVYGSRTCITVTVPILLETVQCITLNETSGKDHQVQVQVVQLNDCRK
jgi:hypothetical protein